MKMAKVIIWNLMTLDGFFEGENKWDLGFHGDAWGDELAAMAKDFGTKAGLLVFGRVTHDGMKAYWTTTEAEEDEIKAYMNALPKLVASRTITSSDWNNTRVTADPVGEIGRLRQQDGKPIYVFGSADLCDSLLKAGVVDEVMLAVVPVTIGKGTPLFKPHAGKEKFRLIESRPLGNGTVIMRYQPENAA
jgi:dihydrofolate reductase